MKTPKNLTLFECHHNYIGRRYSPLYSIFFFITAALFPFLSTTLFRHYYYCICHLQHILFLHSFPCTYRVLLITFYSNGRVLLNNCKPTIFIVFDVHFESHLSLCIMLELGIGKSECTPMGTYLPEFTNLHR